MNAPAAGWYPDPRGAATCRWWDGSTWTRELSSDPRAPAPTDRTHPGAESDLVRPAPRQRYDPRSDPAYVRPTRPGPARTAPTATDPAVSARPGRGSVLPVLLGVGLLVLLVVLGAVVLRARDRTGVAPLPPPAPVAAPSVPVVLDSATRRAQVADVTAEFPGRPWVSQPDDGRGDLSGLFSRSVVTQTTVHENYRGDDDWTASMFLGLVDPAVLGADEAATATSVERQLRSRFYADIPTTPGRAKTNTTTVAGRPVSTRQVDLALRVPGLDSSYDRLTILVIGPAAGPTAPTAPTASPSPAGSAPTVAFVSVRPDDLPGGPRRQLDATLDSLQLA